MVHLARLKVDLDLARKSRLGSVHRREITWRQVRLEWNCWETKSRQRELLTRQEHSS
jgi:hypothetical protein